jgi:hypothetical protein
MEAPDTASGYYFCASIGFKSVPFVSDQAQEKSNTIKVVLLEPGKLARVADIDASLEGMQKIVDGCIEGYYPFESWCVSCATTKQNQRHGFKPSNTRRRYCDRHDVMHERRTFSAKRSATAQAIIFRYVVLPPTALRKLFRGSSHVSCFQQQQSNLGPIWAGYSIYGSLPLTEAIRARVSSIWL